jgi:hypothetical protein
MRKTCRLAFCLALAAAASLGADTVLNDRNDEDRDIQALREWINTKRQVSLKELGGDLAISGEVRTEFQSTWETRNGESQRGARAFLLAPRSNYDIEATLMFDYRTDSTWAAVKLEFDNTAGIFNGTFNNLRLERAYWGVRLADTDDYSVDIEIGRRNMTAIFDSKIEFGSFFDGALVRYDRSFEKVGDFYIHPGALLVFNRRNQFAYVVEVGLLNIASTGLYAKYSIIDWHTRHYHKESINNRFRFLVSQGILGYRFKMQCLEKMGVFYMAGLVNHLAKRLKLTDKRRANWGAYIGLSLGQLRKQWDWAFDINYQAVSAQAIPDFDVSGIGIGNANRSGFYTQKITPIDGGGPNLEREKAGGKTNYRGFSITFDLLLTDKLDWQNSYVQSITLDSHIGPFRTFKQYEMEFIYTW